MTVSTKEWHRLTMSQAQDAFKDHVVKVIGPGHWKIKKPGTRIFSANIVVMDGCAIAVWGDIDACVFAYYSGPPGPENVISWMANADIEYYGRQKASIGMGDIDICGYVDDVALYDIDKYSELIRDDYDYDKWERISSVYTDAFHSAREAILNGEHIKIVHDGLIRELMEVDQDAYEWVTTIGRVTSVRVIYALTAIRKLWELLKEKNVIDHQSQQVG